MVLTNVAPELLEITTEALNRFAKHLASRGHTELAATLIEQAANLELMSPDLQACWGGPFNGQHGRIALITELLAAVKPQAIVETGTYRGISTLWFADHADVPVWSCEKEELYRIQARHRLRASPNVHLELGDSREFLRRLIPQLEDSRPVLFYLDAHWESDLPLKDELQIIFATQTTAVVVIDDFNVPDDPGYNWDDYGPGKRLDVTQFIGTLPDAASLYFPNLPSSEESGARRGCCVVAFDSSPAIDRCNLLKRLSLSDALSRLGLPSDLDGSHPNEQEAESSSSFSSDTETVLSLRQKNARINLDRAHRLHDIKVLTNKTTSLKNEIDLLMSERAIQLRDIDVLTEQITTLKGEVDLLRSERVIHLRDNERLTNQLTENLSAQERERSDYTSLINTLIAEKRHHLQELESIKFDHNTQQERIARLTDTIIRLQSELESRNLDR